MTETSIVYFQSRRRLPRLWLSWLAQGQHHVVFGNRWELNPGRGIRIPRKVPSYHEPITGTCFHDLFFFFFFHQGCTGETKRNETSLGYVQRCFERNQRQSRGILHELYMKLFVRNCATLSSEFKVKNLEVVEVFLEIWGFYLDYLKETNFRVNQFFAELIFAFLDVNRENCSSTKKRICQKNLKYL